VVRPECKILQAWAECFTILYKNPKYDKLASKNNLIRIFLHQAALVGAVLNNLEQKDLLEFPLCINYPLFFKSMFGANQEFDDLTDVITLRYDAYFRDPAPDWNRLLKGDQQIIQWLTEKLSSAYLSK